MTSRKSTSGSANHEAVLSFDYGDPERARRVAASVRPEAGDVDGDRSRATLARDGGTVRVRVAATDLVALRAGVNTWATLVGVAEGVDGG